VGWGMVTYITFRDQVGEVPRFTGFGAESGIALLAACSRGIMGLGGIVPWCNVCCFEGDLVPRFTYSEREDSRWAWWEYR